MLKSVRFVNWKSFRDATLHLDPLTVLIGANASGKSNAVEGLELLARLARGADLETALSGNEQLPALRGGVEWAGYRGAEQMTFEVLAHDERTGQDLIHRQVIRLKPELRVTDSSLVHPDGGPAISLNALRPSLVPVLEQAVEGVATYLRQAQTAQTATGAGRDRPVASVEKALQHTRRVLEQKLLVVDIFTPLLHLFVLAPDPARMRVYGPLSDTLSPDGGNLAGVIAALADDERKEVEATLTANLAKLPEYRVRRLYVERFGLHKSDAMLCCEEQWGSPIDARCMSDGTLRFVAIFTALLTRPAGSLLVIEDVDIGIHPSRFGLVLDVLRTEGKRRGVDVLVTTHNEAFLDAMPPETWPFVTVAYRDGETGESRLSPIDELADYGRILAAGPLGRAVARGVVEQAVRAEPRQEPGQDPPAPTAGETL